MIHTTTTEEHTMSEHEHLINSLAAGKLHDLAEKHALKHFTLRELNVLVADEGGAVLADMMRSQLWTLEESLRDVASESARLNKKATELAEGVAAALHVTTGWVEQAASALVEAVRKRDNAVRQYQSLVYVADKLIDTRVAEAGEER